MTFGTSSFGRTVADRCRGRFPGAASRDRRFGGTVGRACFVVVAGLVLTGLVLTGAARAGSFSIVEHTDDRIRVAFDLGEIDLREVELDGESFFEIVDASPVTTDEPGRPALPRFSTLLGLPPGATASVEVVSTDFEPRPGVRVRPVPESHIAPPDEPGGVPTPYETTVVDGATYDRAVPYPAQAVSLGRPGRVRNQRVVPLDIVPFRSVGGATPSLEVMTRVVVDVTVHPSSDARRYAPVVESDRSEVVYGRLLNRDEARRWRAREVSALSPSLLRRSFGAANPEAKIRVAFNDNEWVRVNWDALDAAGWSETPSIGDLRLSSRGYDASQPPESRSIDDPIGIHIVDENSNGTFDAGDWFAFYAQDAPSQRSWNELQMRYTGENVYWLTWAPGAGSAMSLRDVAPGDASDADAEPTRFEYWERFEQNTAYYPYAFNDDALSDQRQAVDHLFMTNWISIVRDDVRVAFDVVDPAPGTAYGFRAELRSMFTNFTPAVMNLAISGGGGAPVTLPGMPVEVNSDNRYLYDETDLSIAGGFAAGANELVLSKVEVNEEYVLNWFEVGYERQYRAASGALHFTNGGETGRVRYSIDGFDPGSVLAFDMTDPNAPVRLTNGTVVAGTYTFEDDVVDERDYSAVSVSALRELTTEIELDTPSAIRDLTGPQLNADILVVAADDFVDALTPLVERRTSQGHVVDLVAVSDVYDEFSGGVFSPEAIREYVRWAYGVRPLNGGTQPLYLLLVGDASEDYWNIHRSDLTDPTSEIISGPNHVPGYMVLGDASDLARDPIILTDFWYIANPNGDDEANPFLSSMMVGRLPTGSAMETETVVDKILTYEDGLLEDEGQEWRNRGILVADDLYSGAGAGGKGVGAYSRRSSERRFIEVSEAAIDSVSANGYDDLEIETFFLADFLDDVPELDRGGGTVTTPECSWSCTNRFVRNCMDLDGTFIDRLNRGHLFATYQGHGNRSLIAHEYILMGNGDVGTSPWFECPSDSRPNDVEDRLSNGDRLPVWFFFACHVAEMARRDEGLNRIGDSLGERLILHRGGGSIATIASTGFEWLVSAQAVQGAMFTSWFGVGGRLADAITESPYMLLGEIILGAKNTLATWGGVANEGMVESYIMLGDPAMRIDIAPPRMHVWQDAGTDPWDDPTNPDEVQPGRLRAADTSTTSAYFAATLFDEVPIEEVWVTVEPLDGDPVDVPDTAYELVPGETIPIGDEDRVRAFMLRYDHPLEASNYDLVLHARDTSGRERRFVLESRVDVTFSRVDGTGTVVPLPEGSLIAAGERLEIDVSAPIGLAAYEFELAFDGAPIALTAEAVADGRVGERSFAWRLTGTVPEVSGGAHTLAFRWPNGASTEEVSLGVTSGEGFRLDRYFAFPSPFSDTTSFFYRVTQPVQSATVKVYTLSGRLIRTLDQPFPGVDLNRIEWDGRDEDGDHVANGTYFYRLELVDPSGATLVEQGKVARVLGHQVSGS